MKQILTIGLLSLLPFVLVSQVDGEIEFELEETDISLIKSLTQKIQTIQGLLTDHSAAAFDAVYSHMDGIPIDELNQSGKYTFSLFNVAKETLFSYFPTKASIFIDFMVDLYEINDEKSKHDSEVVYATNVNSLKELFAQIARKRVSIFSKTDPEIAIELLDNFKKEGRSFLRNMQSQTAEYESFLRIHENGVKLQTLYFEFEILEELINGLNNKNYPGKDLFQCEVWLKGCPRITGWTESISTGCSEIIRARYSFSGGVSQQFASAMNDILKQFANFPLEMRKMIVDLDVYILYKVYPIGGDYSNCSIEVHTIQNNRIQNIIGNNFLWHNCGIENNLVLVEFENNGSLEKRLNLIVKKINTARSIHVGMNFFD
jgi:hypothetical protein